MEKKSLTWILIMTPLQLKNTVPVLNDEKVNCVFYTGSLNIKELKKTFPGSNFQLIPPNIFRKKDVLKSPLSSLFKYRKIIKQYVDLIENKIQETDGKNINLFCGSDKNLFLQLLANKLRDTAKLSCLASIDEGLGHYARRDELYWVKNAIYRFITRPLLGVKYDYVDVLGSWRLVQQVWVRWPELLEHRNTRIKYRQILKEKSKFQVSTICAKKVLFLSTPFAVDRIMSVKEEDLLYGKILRGVSSKGFEIDIKPHPRDDSNKFDFLSENTNLHVFNGKEIAEDIDYWGYNYVINFGSSVVLDMIDQGYPPRQIITLDLLKATKKIPIFNLTVVCRKTEELIDQLKE